MGATVILASRSREKNEIAAKEVIKESGNQNLICMDLDLGSFASIRKFVANFNELNLPLHVLINNAGLFTDNKKLTEDGFAEVVGVNYFGPFLLTHLLTPSLIKTKGRIVVVSSDAYKWGYIDHDNVDLKGVTRDSGFTEWFKVYSSSKLGNLLFAQKYAEEMKPYGVAVNAVHPGFVETEIGMSNEINAPTRMLVQFCVKTMSMSSWDGAQNSLYVATSPDLDGVTGQFFMNCKPLKEFLNPIATNEKERNFLWEYSLKALGLNNHQW
eukprot:TRINITY_DN1111_c0_g1_i4.p1 TRINITY_DN1111_c0_g1~~TRINITY_DN1111_c0_g1_i4.p1  ORF type:complete len:269 (-),score=41.84 TRINITY_DN1111_c0_g1_i4:96-902(-)